MRYLGTCLLAAALVLPVSAQAAKFVKIEIALKSEALMKHANKTLGKDRPENVLIRLPISLAKAFLENIEGDEIKVNGKNKPGLKPDQLMSLLDEFKSGDLLLEITTDKGDLIKITLE